MTLDKFSESFTKEYTLKKVFWIAIKERITEGVQLIFFNNVMFYVLRLVTLTT